MVPVASTRPDRSFRLARSNRHDGAALRIEPIAGEGTIEVGGRLVIDAEVTMNDEDVREMRFTDQR